MNVLARAYLFGLLALAAGAGGCGRPAAPPEAGREPETCRVTRRDIVERCREDGRLQAVRVYSIFPEVGAARLRAVYVREGDWVEAEARLYAFETGPLVEQIEILRARTNLVARRMAEARTHAARQRLDGEVALDAATRELQIQEQLLKQGLASEADVEALRKKRRSAELAPAVAGAADPGAPVSAEAAELAAQGLEHARSLRLLEEQVDKCTGAAPFAGRILRINDAIKEYGGDTTALDMPFQPGRGPLLILADTREMRILARFFERDVAGLRPGQEATVTAEHAPGRTFEGRILSVGEIGYAHGQTSTVVVEALVANGDGLLKPGLTAELSIRVAEQRGVPAIPSRFLRRDDANESVWRREGDTVKRVPVTTGACDEEYVEIVAGLREGDVVVME